MRHKINSPSVYTPHIHIHRRLLHDQPVHSLVGLSLSVVKHPDVEHAHANLAVGVGTTCEESHGTTLNQWAKKAVRAVALVL